MKNLKSIVDLKWHHSEANLIASAPTNGSVMYLLFTKSVYIK
jgi:hypothetical protein